LVGRNKERAMDLCGDALEPHRDGGIVRGAWVGADIERTSAHTCDTMSLAFASGMGKGSSRDSARAMARGVGSLISMTVTNGLPLQWGGGKG
jgi:hypothetical protein